MALLDLLVPFNRKVFPFGVYPPIGLYEVMKFMFVCACIALEISGEAVGYLIVFTFDISYVKVESGHVVHPSALSIRQLCL